MVMFTKGAPPMNDQIQPSPDHTLEPFYQPSNMEALHRSIEEMLQGKTVTRTLEELTALEDD
jgi:toxin-antitoxin system protein